VPFDSLTDGRNASTLHLNPPGR